MSTLLLSHKACLDHVTPPGHPERPDRLRAVEEALSQSASSSWRATRHRKAISIS